jgi:hypothetical protein
MHVYATPEKINENRKKFSDLRDVAIPWTDYFGELGLPVQLL